MAPDRDAGVEVGELEVGVLRAELVAQLQITNVRPFGTGAMVTSEAEITDAGGAHVVTATSVLLIGGEDA